MTEKEITRDLSIMLGDPKEAVRTMAWPLIISFLVVQINSIADATWCSLLGLDPSSAVATISPVYWIITGVGTGLGVGASTAIARRLGQKDRLSAESLLAQTLAISTVISFAIGPVVYLLLDPAISMMGAADLNELCRQYIDPMVICTLPLVMNGVVSGVLRAEGASKKSTIMLLTAAILNIILNPIFMFGLDMGVAGAGWATAVSTLISTIVGLRWYVKGSMYLSLSFKGFRFNWTEIREILFVAVPRATEFFLISFLAMIQRIFLFAAGGALAAALYNIPWRFVTLLGVISQATGSALIPISSAALGQNDVGKAHTANVYTLKITLIWMIAFSVLLFIFADYAIIPFTMSPSMEIYRPEFAMVTRLYAVFIPFVGLIDVGSSILQSLRLAQLSMIASFLRNVLIIILMIFTYTISLDAVFYSIFIAEIAGGILMIGMAAYEFRKITRMVSDTS